jgi:hypothetical protein
MTTLDSLTKTFDNLFITTMQNILGTNIEICKWSFLFTSVGVGINVILNSFYFVKVSNENNILKSKINLLLNETKVINESNITIYEMLQKNTFKIDSLIKNTNYEKTYLLDDVVEDYCMPNCDF